MIVSMPVPSVTPKVLDLFCPAFFTTSSRQEQDGKFMGAVTVSQGLKKECLPSHHA
jgi:hypothetical protein